MYYYLLKLLHVIMIFMHYRHLSMGTTAFLTNNIENHERYD